ncbi:MAG TPA: PilZ domain-containing protein [Sandaracinaceae bacterium]
MSSHDSRLHRVWFPIGVRTAEGDERTAIALAVSASGVLVACSDRFAVGDRVRLSFRARASDAAERAIGGSVRRVRESPSERGPWRCRMTVHFDEEQPELAGVLAP